MSAPGVSTPGGVCSRGVSAPKGVPGGDPPTDTAAGGTNPAGMHSCQIKMFYWLEVVALK